MDAAAWSVVVGLLFVLIALSGSTLKHLPISTAMLYLLVGVVISPWGVGLVNIDPIADATLIEHLTELVVVVALFSVGIKLNLDLGDRRWRVPLRLALTSMVLTVALMAVAGLALGLSWGAAVLLGAILAPTDPVLASDVQLSGPEDRSRVRLALTGEGGLNDGTAFPLVMLGLGLLGLHPLGEWGLRWFLVDVLWAVFGGLAIGGLLGMLTGHIVLYLRTHHALAVGHDEFLALGLIALAYGVALYMTTYGFLAVFAAGVALGQVIRQASATSPPPNAGAVPTRQTLADQIELSLGSGAQAEEVATHPSSAPAFLRRSMLASTEQIERIGEVAAVVLLGAMLWAVDWSLVAWWFAPVLLLGVRPIAIILGLVGSEVPGAHRRLIAWFGVKGIGSLYYLSYSITHGLDSALAPTLVALTLAAVVTSIVAHGVSVTPLMRRHEKAA